MRPRLDLSELFLRLVFCFLTGNSDMHLKNFSLVETQAGSGEYILSPAYDLLPVNIIMPEDPEELALQLNGKKSNLRKKNFLAFAENAGIAQKAAEAMIRDQLKSGKLTLKEVIDMKDDPIVGRMKVSTLIETLPGYGKAKSEKIMGELQIAESRRLRGLGERQQAALLERLG